MSIYSTLAAIHIGAGTVALATYWLAGLSKKGSPLHKGAGKVYLATMATLLLMALPMSVQILLVGHTVGGSFLLYLLVITATATWSSWRAIKDKRDWRRYTGPVYQSLMWLNLASAAGIAVVGARYATEMRLIIVSFAGVGLITFFRMWRFSRSEPSDPRWWLGEHLRAMLGNGVATHIAFLAIGLPRLLPALANPSFQNLAWLGPLALSFIAGRYLTRKYLPKRPERQAPPQTSPSLNQPSPVPR